MNAVRLPAIPLESAFTFQEGPGLRKWQFQSEGIKVLNVGNITRDGRLDLSRTDRFISEDEVKSRYSHFLVDDGDLVIASSGISFDEDGYLRTRGAFVSKEDLPLCMNTSTIRFKARQGISDLRYLRHWIDSLEFRKQISRLVTGSAQQNFGPSHLRAVMITLPSLDEQHRVAAILDKAHALRRKRKRAVDLIEDLSQSIFLEMFGDLEINSRNWRVLKFDEVVTIDAPLVDPKLPKYASLLHYGPDRIERNTGKLLPAQTAEQDQLISGKFLCNQAHILYSKIRPYLNKVALSESDCLCSADVYPISTNAEVADRFYIWYLLRSKAFLQFAESCSNRANIPKINREQLLAYEAPIPPLPLQQDFAKRIASTQKVAQGLGRSESATRQLFSSLQSRAFSGQL